MQFFVPVISQLLVQLPLLITWTVGLVMAIRYRRTSPTKARLVGIALVILMLDFVLGASAGVLPFMLGLPPDRIGIVFMAIGLVRSIFMTIAWILILRALFRTDASADRPPTYTP